MVVLTKNITNGTKFATMKQSASLLKIIGDISKGDFITVLTGLGQKKKPIKNISNGLYENN